MRPIDADVFEEYLKGLHDKYAEDIEECKREGRTSGASYLNTHKELLINIMLRLKQQPTVNEWIPYVWGERTPKESIESCTVTYKGFVKDDNSPSGWIEKEFAGVGKYNADADDWMVGHAKTSPYEVIAYMPLPERYKGDEDK